MPKDKKTNKNVGGMDVLNLSQYVEASYEETANNSGYVDYGVNNLFPQYLVDLYKSSATHGALCNTIAQMIFGDGVSSTDPNVSIKFEEWGLNDTLRKVSLDLKIQGGFALEIIYSLDRTSITEVRHIPFETIRAGEVNDADEIDYYFYSRNWEDSQEEVKEICAFDPDRKIDHPHQILYVKPFSPGSFYYPKPDYIGAINYIEVEKSVALYHINNIRNGLTPSFSIHFKNGVPAQDERNRIRQDIERQLSGPTNAGKFVITYSDSPDRKPDFEPFPMSDADKQYEFLSRESTDKIMIGHRVVSSAMFGVKTSGELGNTQELEIASTLFSKQVVLPFQRIIKESISTLLHACDMQADFDLKELNLVPEVVEEKSRFSSDKEDKEREEYKNAFLEALIDKGEVIGDDYEEIDSREVEYDREVDESALYGFASTIQSTGNNGRGESEQDNELFKIRYKYAPDASTHDPQRSFCSKMINSGKVYTMEDIQDADGANPGFGIGGSKRYSIWFFKGGPNCFHWWERVIYLQKDNDKISVNEARKRIRELPYDMRKDVEIERNDIEVARRPRDMANNGYYN
tara:strand:+ start:4241 stop:5965 length:1725 start_codon:yes stop_codon:yes gene_type:complete